MFENSKRQVKVSYIITTFNRADFLNKAIENVREFITPEDELLVIDAGSSDHTFDIVDKHKDIITYFASESDFGEAHGFNKGILESTGQFIKLMTDDDYFYPDAMRKVVSIMENKPELDAVLCGGEEYYYDLNTGATRLVQYQYLPQTRSLTDDPSNTSNYVTCGIGLMLNRQVVSRVGLLDTSFHAVDLDYLARLMACGVNFKYLDIKLWRHVNYPHSGENQRDKCEWDRIRVYLRNRAWSNVMLYPLPIVGKILGLHEVESGNVLANLLMEANWLRQKMPFLLKFLTRCLLSFHGVCKIVGKAIRLTHSLKTKKDKGQVPRTDILTEPSWDESLR